MNMTLKIHDISCNYGSYEVLKDLTYEFPQGSFVGIIGPNGSGKSTLLNAMARTLKPNKGLVYLGKEDIFKIPSKEVAKSVGVVPQNTNVNFNFTAHEIVMMGRNPYLSRFGWEQKQDLDIVKSSMEATVTWSLKDKFIGDLSGGERQRVIISRALAQEPKILLLDEPTSHLDITHQLEILQLLKKLNTEENISVIIVIHDLNLGAQYCKELILLKEGKIFSAGTVKEVLTEENIKKVYNTDVIISDHPIWDVPSITLLPKDIKKEKASLKTTEAKQIHLVCGGGSGKDLINDIVTFKVKLTLGVLNQFDLDWEIAKGYGLEMIEEKPFCPISEDSYEANLNLMTEADLIILSDVPIGHGNISNLKGLLKLQGAGKKILITEGKAFTERDFTNGEGLEVLNQLILQGAQLIKKEEMLNNL